MRFWLLSKAMTLVIRLAHSSKRRYLVMAFGFTGCVAEVFTPENAPTYEIQSARAPLYQFGPQQVAPPDAWLREGTQVRMLRREFGYSFVQLDTDQTGYVANLDLKKSESLTALQSDPSVDALPLWTPEPTRPARNLPIIDDAPLPEPDLDGELDDPPAL